MEKDITINDISLKAKSKKGVYLVLTSEGGIYFPQIGDSNKEYLRDIITGRKKFLYCKSILTVKVPHLKTLSIKEILNFVRNKTEIDYYLPVYKYNKFPDREWLCNVINTIANNEFRIFISSAMKNREKMMVNRMRLNVEAIPEIINIFAKSSNVSYMKGRTHFLMRPSKDSRKRKYTEIEMDSKEEEQKEISRFKSKVEELEEEIEQFKKREELFLKDNEKLVILYQDGYINSDGEPIDEK